MLLKFLVDSRVFLKLIFVIESCLIVIFEGRGQKAGVSYTVILVTSLFKIKCEQ